MRTMHQASLYVCHGIVHPTCHSVPRTCGWGVEPCPKCLVVVPCAAVSTPLPTGRSKSPSTGPHAHLFRTREFEPCTGPEVHNDTALHFDWSVPAFLVPILPATGDEIDNKVGSPKRSEHGSATTTPGSEGEKVRRTEGRLAPLWFYCMAKGCFSASGSGH